MLKGELHTSDICWREVSSQYYKEAISEESSDLYKYHLAKAVEEADKCPVTRMANLVKLYKLNDKLVDGYLVTKYNKRIMEIFPQAIDIIFENHSK